MKQPEKDDVPLWTRRPESRKNGNLHLLDASTLETVVVPGRQRNNHSRPRRQYGEPEVPRLFRSAWGGGGEGRGFGGWVWRRRRSAFGLILSSCFLSFLT